MAVYSITFKIQDNQALVDFKQCIFDIKFSFRLIGTCFKNRTLWIHWILHNRIFKIVVEKAVVWSFLFKTVLYGAVMIIDNYYYHFVSITVMNSIFVTIYFFEWRWLIDFLANLVLTSFYFSSVFLSIRSKLKSEIKKCDQ